MSHELVFGDELERHLQLRGWHKERLEAKGCPGGPNDKGAFHEELVVPSQLSRATWKSLEGMK